MRALALLVASGCSSIFGLDSPSKLARDASVELTDAMIDARIDAPPNAPPLCNDNFDDNVIDARWMVVTAVGHTISEVNQQLVLRFEVIAGRRTGLELPLVGASHVVRVDAVQVPPNSVDIDMYVGLYRDDQNFVELIFQNATLIARVTAQGTTSDNGLPYDASAYRFWEIETTQSGVVTFRAGNASSATILRQVTVGFSVDGGKVGLYGRTNGVPAFPGAGAFDNFALASAKCPP